MKKTLIFLFVISIISFFSCVEKQLEIKLIETELEYNSDSTKLKGFLVYNGNLEGKRPGVLVVHEWWGHNEYARKRARMLAELGYTALAIDMFGDGKQANHPEDAGKFAMEIFNNVPEAEARFLAAYELLKNNENTDAENIAAVGYCFGGSVALHMARIGTDLKVVASFHGGLQAITPAESNIVKAFVLVCNGADDPLVPAEQIEAFKNEMDNAGVKYEFKNYPGAVHSFTNPGSDEFGKKFGMPLAYNENADKESWTELQKVLTTVFNK
jgi:dienelactone hydrolase